MELRQSDNVALNRLTASGNLLSEMRYSAYGEVRFTNGAAVIDKLYTGQQQETEIGLDYYIARFYDPVTAHFIQPDSLIPQASASASYNRYAYVNGNPINFNDPSGHAMQIDDGGSCIGAHCLPNQGIPINKSASNTISVTEKAAGRDSDAIIKLITPSHIGGRVEGFVCLVFACFGGGVNLVHNFNDNKTAISIDTMGAAGYGPQAVMPKIGVFASGGPLIGWASSKIEDSTSGISAQFSEFAAAKFGITLSVSSPTNKTNTHQIIKETWRYIFEGVDYQGLQFIGDSIYGTVPTTLYLGGGAGVGAGMGVGLVTTQSREEVTWFNKK